MPIRCAPCRTHGARDRGDDGDHAEDEDPVVPRSAGKLTGSGKVMRRRANKNHLLEHKPSKRTRRLSGPAVVADADAKNIKKLLRK